MAGSAYPDTQPRRRNPITIMEQDHLKLLSEFLYQREKIDPARVTPEATLEELKVDSLLLLELLFEFEDRLGVKIPNDIPPPKTVGDLLRVVEGIQPPAKGA
jgi:acyl carrier protein